MSEVVWSPVVSLGRQAFFYMLSVSLRNYVFSLYSPVFWLRMLSLSFLCSSNFNMSYSINHLEFLLLGRDTDLWTPCTLDRLLTQRHGRIRRSSFLNYRTVHPWDPRVFSMYTLGSEKHILNLLVLGILWWRRSRDLCRMQCLFTLPCQHRTCKRGVLHRISIRYIHCQLLQSRSIATQGVGTCIVWMA
jgi:hypothetical protein